jgi:hypothetical protein
MSTLNPKVVEAFYMTLQSDQSNLYFPRNDSADFSVQLGKTLYFPAKAFEIGLAQFHYTSKAAKRDAGGKIENDVPKFFGNVAGDDLITIDKSEVSGFQITKEEDDVIAFARKLNLEFKRRRFKVNLGLDVDQKTGESTCVVEMDRTDKLSLVIPPELLHVLGFASTRAVFPRGRHRGDYPISPALFSKLPSSTTKFELSLTESKRYAAKVNEPSVYEIVDLVSSINEALADHEAVISYDGASLEYESKNPQMLLQLSPQMYSFLGVEPGVWFRGAEMRVEGNPDIILDTSRNYMLVLCSVVEEQIFGSSFLPILRVIPRAGKANVGVELNFAPIQYVPLSTTSFSHVRVQVVDEHFRPYSLSPEPSTVVLHFRPRPA